MRSLQRDESGVALVIVLTIVALLTITVMEFTYNVQLDRHRTRNSVNAMQAKLLARSGINLAESFLAEDQDDKYDAFNEEWSLALDEFCRGVAIEPTMLLRCSWKDETGKININLARPRGTGPQGDGNRVTADTIIREAIEAVFLQLDIHIDEIGDQLKEYFLAVPPGAGDERRRVPDFGSLEEFAAFFKVPAGKLGKLRRLLTAQPGGKVTKINVNTAPEEVLRALLVGQGGWDGGQEALDSVLEGRSGDPPYTETGSVAVALGAIDEKVRNGMAQLVGVSSSFFRLEASGLTNADPTGGALGGIGQTLSVLVRRTRQANPRNGGKAGINWTFRRLDWQKEAGARLFREPTKPMRTGAD